MYSSMMAATPLQRHGGSLSLSSVAKTANNGSLTTRSAALGSRSTVLPSNTGGSNILKAMDSAAQEKRHAELQQ